MSTEPTDATGPRLDGHDTLDDDLSDVSPAYRVALGVYAAVLPTLADHQVEGRLRSVVDGRRVADTRALLELIERRIPRPGPSLAAAMEQGRLAVSQGTW